jgi:integrase
MQGCRPLSDDEITSMREQLRHGRLGARNEALFVLGLNTGFRVSELLALRRADLIDERGQIVRRVQVARRHMKGHKTSRSVLLNAAAMAVLSRWLCDSGAMGYMHGSDPVFCTQSGKRMSRFHAYRMLRQAALDAGVVGKVATHSMRKTFANGVYSYFLGRVAKGEALDPFRATSRALGHAAITSTDKYLTFRTEDVDQAVSAIAAHSGTI